MRKAKLTIVTELQSMLAKLAGKLPTHLSLSLLEITKHRAGLFLLRAKLCKRAESLVSQVLTHI